MSEAKLILESTRQRHEWSLMAGYVKGLSHRRNAVFNENDYYLLNELAKMLFEVVQLSALKEQAKAKE